MNKKGKGLIPPGLTYIADNITSKHNILGVPKGWGARWAEDLNLPKERETIFFAGCGYQYTSRLESLISLLRKMDKSVIGAELPMSIAAFPKKLGIDLAGIYGRVLARGNDAQPLMDAVKVLSNLGVEFGYLADDEPCCGGLLHYIGLQAEFAQNAQQVYNKLKSLGVKQIIGIVPSCTYILRSLIPSCVDRFDLEVKHFSEVILENIQSRELCFPREVKVTYHDPCQLSRYLGLIAQPRQILRAIKGVELIETDWTKEEWATCCGGGGGFEVVFPELSQILAVNRARELLETGAEIIITHCPGCIIQLKEGLKELKTDGVEVVDLAQILIMAMEG
ncbi:(Fe-S)-binding protein [Dehalococcoidales bacterium]|nr:(Fe-S)-binding protein [Dehalococcoidales bacterium]